MAESVFILGAGASKKAGAPLMGEFMDAAHDVSKKHGKDHDVKIFSEVFDARDKLESLYSKSFIDLGNIEDLFGVVEMAGLIKKFPNYDVEKIDKLKGGLLQLIAKTLEYSIVFPKVEREVRPPVPYETFVSLLSKFSKTNNIFDCSVMTFNYDVCLDYTLDVKYIPYSYCLDEKQSTIGLPLLKLHGSLNWTDCKKCGSVIPVSPLDYVTRQQSGPQPYPETDDFHILISSHLMKLASDYIASKKISKCCDDMVISGSPVLVPPTWSKTSYRGSIVNVWGRAAKELGEAENIYVIGYSLPETDSFFRYLYSLGSISNIPIKRFWVFNPDEDGTVEPRFDDMIGRSIKGKFDFQKLTFSEAINYVNDKL